MPNQTPTPREQFIAKIEARGFEFNANLSIWQRDGLNLEIGHDVFRANRGEFYPISIVLNDPDTEFNKLFGAPK